MGLGLFWLVLQCHESSSQARPIVTLSKIGVLLAERREDKQHPHIVLLSLHPSSSRPNGCRKAEDMELWFYNCGGFFFLAGQPESPWASKQQILPYPQNFQIGHFRECPEPLRPIREWLSWEIHPQSFNLVPHIIQLLGSTLLFQVWLCCGYDGCWFWM